MRRWCIRACAAGLLVGAAACDLESSREAQVGNSASGSSSSSESSVGATSDVAGTTGVPGTHGLGESGGTTEVAVEESSGSIPPQPPLEIVGCEPVGVVDSDGVFSMASFAGKLQIGQFGYGREGSSMQYAYPEFAKVEPGLRGIGESVCAMMEFDGWLYANTENSGDIQRSLDGQHWERVHDGHDGVIGCDLVAHSGALYAVNYDWDHRNHGQILRSSDGATWTTVYDSGADGNRYLREIASHKGRLMAFSVDTDSRRGYVLRSIDGQRWTEAAAPARFFRSTVWDGELWLSSTERSSDGVSGLWTTSGDDFELRYTSPRPYVTELAVWRDVLFAGTSDGWKDDVGTSTVLMTRDGETWEQVCDDFDELAAWSLAVHDDRLFVGTWEFGSQGRVYEVLAR